MIQFLKFACVGIANTLVDLGVLNFLLSIFHVHGSGPSYLACKAASFSVAVAHSYVLNRRWVFRALPDERSGEVPSSPYSKTAFAAVSLAGLVVNTAVAGMAWAAFGAMLPDASPILLANGAALFATATVLAFNFFGYKRLVFRPAVLSSQSS